MRHRSLFQFSILCAFLQLACSVPVAKNTDEFSSSKNNSSVKYARRFSIVNHSDYTLVYLFGNKTNFDTTKTFVIYKGEIPPKDLPQNKVLIKGSCKKIAALSSIYSSMFYELGDLEHLAAIDNIDYVNNAQIVAKHTKGELKELSKGPEINLEQTIALNPDIIFTFGMGDPQKDVNEKLQLTNIPVAVSLDHLEESPLARAEWIKFYAAFVDKKEKGDSIFNTVEKNYKETKAIALLSSGRPTVFSEIKYGDVWYMPGGKSFMAQLISDANGNYLWNDNQNTGSLPLSFEQVYAKAKDGNFWINLSGIKSKQELIGFEPRYSEFAAFKNSGIYNNNRITNALGYSTYWETGMIHPDRILSDLVLILHPQLKSQIKNNLFYYQQIN